MSVGAQKVSNGGSYSRQWHQLLILADAGHSLPQGARVLDFGCGEGASVRALRSLGFDALGCDVVLRDTVAAKELARSGLIHAIQMHPYRLPYDDGIFDAVFSDQVFEHVRNYPETIDELCRVMKPGGISLHIFPSRWRIIEPHVFVPFGTWCRNRMWLSLWAIFGIRNEFQTNKSIRKVVDENSRYLAENTNYLPRRIVIMHFKRIFRDASFREDLFLKYSRRGKYIYSIGRLLPLLVWLYGEIGSSVLIAKK
jgi:SAM-dependent methyltransferase